MPLNWNLPPQETELVLKIARRAAALADRLGYHYTVSAAEMDLTACHNHGCKLDFSALLAAGDGDFGHDVFGIRRYIDRNTGNIADIFCPRYAAQEPTCDCGAAGSWHGEHPGRRMFCCDTCWQAQIKAGNVY